MENPDAILGPEAEIKQKILSLGFDLSGYADARDPLLHEAVERYVAWIDSGKAGSMQYLRRHAEFKAAPTKLLPEARSVICVGLLYGARPAAVHPSRGRVSVYAQGQDYHRELGNRLDALAAWLGERYGARSRKFVDAEPVLERFWGARAGLGWIGKNSMLIHRRLGSYFFLGGLLTSLELKADGPASDHCGRCRKCIDACPTVAINENRELVAEKCIAYHTVENRGSIPEDVMARTGQWVVGCDVCQEVCPWNDPVTEGPIFKPLNPLMEPSLLELLRWTRAEYETRIKPTASSRVKYESFLRNAVIALSNSETSAGEKKQALGELQKSLGGIADGPAKEGLSRALEWALKAL